ncbi:MAG: hypothetical protein BWX76_00516 [Candidatus Cloacimonetes bacterium ADurb.Bin089]|nr:MAG: hypothetical protein BWX76_00516 [Candidatus Cloacimonetes bacterium ADurb.Bin089]
MLNQVSHKNSENKHFWCIERNVVAKKWGIYKNGR